MVQEPSEALASVENALRLIVRTVLGDSWTSQLDEAKLAKLAIKKGEDSTRRDGAVIADDLLAYTELYQLTSFVISDWEKFKPVFDDKKRTEVYFGILEDFRNPSAHSRELATFERELLSGISTQLRNQVALYRTALDPANAHYPLIESIIDCFGQVSGEGAYNWAGHGKAIQRLEVGDRLTFRARAFDPRNRPLHWSILAGQQGPVTLPSSLGDLVGTGSPIEIEYIVPEDVVDPEDFVVCIYLSHGGGKYHRHRYGMSSIWDDRAFFVYAVNPPME